jgi:hypothetical protein
MDKQSIKNILECDGAIQIPFKSEISDWYTELKISKLNKHEYVVHPHWQKFSDIDEAVNWFLNEGFTSKNVGYIQSRLSKKGIDFESEYDLRYPDDDIKKLFDDESKLVDEEAKLLGIVVKPFPKEEDAFIDIEALVKTTTIDKLRDDLLSFERKYMPLDPYLSVSYVYNSPNGVDGEFRSSVFHESFSKKMHDHYTNPN